MIKGLGCRSTWHAPPASAGGAPLDSATKFLLTSALSPRRGPRAACGGTDEMRLHGRHYCAYHLISRKNFGTRSATALVIVQLLIIPLAGYGLRVTQAADCVKLVACCKNKFWLPPHDRYRSVLLVSI